MGLEEFTSLTLTGNGKLTSFFPDFLLRDRKSNLAFFNNFSLFGTVTVYKLISMLTRNLVLSGLILQQYH